MKNIKIYRMSKSEGRTSRGRDLNPSVHKNQVGMDFETEKTKHLSTLELQRLVMLHQLKKFEAQNAQFSSCDRSECDTDETEHLSDNDDDSEEDLSEAKQMQSMHTNKKRKTNPEYKTFDDKTYYKALYKTSKTEIVKLQDEIRRLKKKLEDKEMVEELIKTYQGLNRRLQKQLLRIMESNKGCNDVDASPNNFTFSTFEETSSNPDINENASSNSLDSSLNRCMQSPENEWQIPDEEVKPKTEQIKERRVFSKNGAEKEVYLSEQQIDYINQYKGDSQYIKAMAVGVWGSVVLSTSSITGTVPNRNKNCKARPRLSPKKLQFIKDTFRDRMIKENCSKTEIELRLKNVNRYITEKISDLRRKEKN